MIKLLIADVDGTLIAPDKSLTTCTIDAVARLRAAGVRFTITSGRPPRGMARFIAPLALTEPVAAFNGAVYVMPDLTTVISRHTIAPDVARSTVDYLLGQGLEVFVYQGDDWFVRDRHAFRVDNEARTVGFEPTVIADLHAVLEMPVKITGASADYALVARCEAELNERLGADATAARSQPYYVDVTHPEANKGMVAREAARLCKLSLDDIATIGDMPNDIPMLTIAGTGIAMGNASEQVQRAARHVSRSNAAEGFAYAVDTFILGEPPLARTPLGLPPRARACVFRLDGVLAQAARQHAAAWKHLFDDYLREHARAVGGPFVPFDAFRDYHEHFDRKPVLAGIRAFLDARGIELPEHVLGALAKRKGAIYAELIGQEQLETFEGSLRYLHAARDAGLKIAVVSRSRYCRESLLSAGIADLVDARIDGDVLATRHLEAFPAPDTFLAAAEAVGVASDEAVVFDDELPGVEAARAGHFGYVVAVDRLGRAEELRHHGADVVVPDLASLLEPAAAPAAPP
jgi:Cof subfamily protein (haloacid dehalogenase superfamily)/HAD superfamily hydrolase (TIGR01509 family)